VQHTRLTPRNYAGFATTIFLITSVSVGFGAVDLIMITPKGVDHVAAVGQAELFVAAMSAFFIGIVDTFSSRAAMAEGRGTTAQRLPVLAAAFVLLLLAGEVVGLAITALIEPFLGLVNQQPDLIPLVGDYVGVRAGTVGLLLSYLATTEILKICGLKNYSFAALLAGFGLNALFNWVFLYTGAASHFSSPESAVASATVLAQVLMTAASVAVFIRQLRGRAEPFVRPERRGVLAEFASMARTGPGIGVRHLNDYAAAIIPVLFIGTLGVQAVAAAVVATKIYTLYCRIPQACTSTTFVYYSYAVGRDEPDLAGRARTLLGYAAIPTAIGALIVLALGPWLIDVFGSESLDSALAMAVLLAFMLPLPLYLLEATFAEILSVHQRGGLMSLSSTLATYLLTIPVAWYAVFVLHSAPLAILFSWVSSPLLVLLFWRALRRDHWQPAAPTAPVPAGVGAVDKGEPVG
jgi:multidrug resistance protein, MATE family